jgi:hypothetical protein
MKYRFNNKGVWYTWSAVEGIQREDGCHWLPILPECRKAYMAGWGLIIE